jgi:hypothetical protein
LNSTWGTPMTLVGARPMPKEVQKMDHPEKSLEGLGPKKASDHCSVVTGQNV